MAKTAWPTTTELTNRLTGLGVTSIPTGVTLQDEIDEAVDLLSEVSGVKQFLMDADDVERSYSLKASRVVPLPTPYVSITTVEIDGTALTEGQEYWLETTDGRITHITFAYAWDGEPLTLTVTGKRGYASTIPLRAWNAVLDYAAGKVYRTSAAAGTVASGMVTEVQQDSVRYKFGGGSGASASQDTGSMLMDQACKIFESFRTLSLGWY